MNAAKLAQRSVAYKGVRGQWYSEDEKFGKIANIWSKHVDFPARTVRWNFDASEPKALRKSQVLQEGTDKEALAVIAINVPDDAAMGNDSAIKRKVGLFRGRVVENTVTDGLVTISLEDVHRLEAKHFL